MSIVTLFSLKFNIFFYFGKIFVLNVYPDPHGSAWTRIHFLSWIRIRIKSMRIRNTGHETLGVFL
jgi:hypothetical protein